MTLEIRICSAPCPDLADLVAAHVAFCDGTAPAESCHRLPLGALFGPRMTLWTARRDGVLLGMGALRKIATDAGEIKSMHTLAAARGMGVGRAILRAVLDTAEARRLSTLWLETGRHPGFAAACRLYAAHGFRETGPFGDYSEDPHSLFMTCHVPVRRREEAST